MQLHTKLNVGDMAFFLKDNRVEEWQVSHISIHVAKNNGTVESRVAYTLVDPRSTRKSEAGTLEVSEHACFYTKELLLASL